MDGTPRGETGGIDSWFVFFLLLAFIAVAFSIWVVYNNLSLQISE